MREVLAPILRFLLRPGSLGAIYVLLLAARAATHPAGEEQMLGDQAREVSAFIHDRFGLEVARMAVALSAVALAFGAVLGVIAGALVALRDRMARLSARTRWSTAAMSLGVTAMLHAWLELIAMAKNPQLYADGWYAQGGVLRTVQVVATDVLGPRGLFAAFVVVLVLFLAGPFSEWKNWPRRLSRAFLPAKVRRLRPARAASILSAMVAVVLAGQCLRAPVPVAHAGPAPAAAPQPGRLNVIVLAADSLRADRLNPRIAPRLSALADRGARFDRAYVSLPRTFPSWVTLLTGRHPHHHGIRSMFPRWDERAKDFDALPNRFARSGYASSVVSDYAGDIFDRIDLGWGTTSVPSFDFKQLIRQRALERQTPLLPVLHSRAGRAAFPVLRELNDAADPDMLADDAISAIDGMREAPFFLTVFFSTAHFPYAAPAPYYGRFTDPAYRGRFKYHKPVGLGHEAPPDAEDIAQVRGLYDGAVASIDNAIGRVLDHLERAHLQDRTIIVVTADHGETLYEDEHGQGHGDHLFGDQAIHVPLLIIDPRQKTPPQKIAQIVRDVDLAPTLYELAGIAAPSDLDGRSLVPAMGGAPLPPVLAYAETGLWFTSDIPGLPEALRLPYPNIARLTEIDPEHGDEIVLQKAMRPLTVVAKHRMVRDERWKLIYAPTRAGVRLMLYDTQLDPGETHDVAGEHPAEVARLRGELFAWMLRDRDMRLQGDFLVPREVSASTAIQAAPLSAIRLPGTP